MHLLRIVHIICALFSIIGFMTRGILMLRDSVVLQRRWIRIAPHMIDTLLLASAIWLVVLTDLDHGGSLWLMAKIIALLIYIGLGAVALHWGKSKQIRSMAWIAALLVFAYIVAVAVTKLPLVFV